MRLDALLTIAVPGNESEVLAGHRLCLCPDSLGLVYDNTVVLDEHISLLRLCFRKRKRTFVAPLQLLIHLDLGTNPVFEGLSRDASLNVYSLTTVNYYLYYGFTSQTSLVILMLHILRLLAGMDAIGARECLKYLRGFIKDVVIKSLIKKNVWPKINKHLVIRGMMEDGTGSKLGISNKTD